MPTDIWNGRAGPGFEASCLLCHSRSRVTPFWVHLPSVKSTAVACDEPVQSKLPTRNTRIDKIKGFFLVFQHILMSPAGGDIILHFQHKEKYMMSSIGSYFLLFLYYYYLLL